MDLDVYYPSPKFFSPFDYEKNYQTHSISPSKIPTPSFENFILATPLDLSSVATFLLKISLNNECNRVAQPPLSFVNSSLQPNNFTFSACKRSRNERFLLFSMSNRNCSFNIDSSGGVDAFPCQFFNSPSLLFRSVLLLFIFYYVSLKVWDGVSLDSIFFSFFLALFQIITRFFLCEYSRLFFHMK